MLWWPFGDAAGLWVYLFSYKLPNKLRLHQATLGFNRVFRLSSVPYLSLIDIFHVSLRKATQCNWCRAPFMGRFSLHQTGKPDYQGHLGTGTRLFPGVDCRQDVAQLVPNSTVGDWSQRCGSSSKCDNGDAFRELGRLQSLGTEPRLNIVAERCASNQKQRALGRRTCPFLQSPARGRPAWSST